MINIDYIQLGNTIHNRFTLDLHQTILHLHVRTGTQAHTHAHTHTLTEVALFAHIR